MFTYNPLRHRPAPPTPSHPSPAQFTANNPYLRKLPSSSEWANYLSLYHSMGNLQVSSGQYSQAAKSFASAIILGCGGIVDERYVGTGTRNDLIISPSSSSLSSIPNLINAINHALNDPSSPVTTGDDRSHNSPLLLSPRQALDCRFKLFPPSGKLPLIIHCLDENLSNTPEIPVDSLGDNSFLNPGYSNNSNNLSTIEALVSNALLNLAKIYQDGINSGVPDRIVYLNGRVPSPYDILSLYLLSLSINASASTSNNIGILLASLAQNPVSSPSSASSSSVTSSSSSESLSTYETRTRNLAFEYYLFGLSLDQKHPHLHTNLGSLLREQGRLSEAVQMYQNAIRYDPHFNIALANLAGCLKDQGQIDKAIVYYSKAVYENPDFVEALVGLASCHGSVCNWDGRGGYGWETFSVDNKGNLIIGQIEGWVTRVIKIAENQIDDAKKWGTGSIDFIEKVDGGSLFKEIDRAIDNNDQRANLKNRVHSWKGKFNEGSNLLSLIERSMKRIQRKWYFDRLFGTESPSRYMYCRPKIPSVLPIPLATSILPFHAFTLPLNSFMVRQISERAAARVSISTLSQSWLPSSVYPPPLPPANSTANNDVGILKVAYISSDFANHPLAHLMQNVFGMHDRSRVLPYCYGTTASDSSHYRHTIEQGSYVFKDVSSWSTQKIVEELVSDGIHIAVNLNGFTKGGRNEIFAARPCPIQICLMGFAGPMGANWCDYILGDVIAMNGLPPEKIRENEAEDEDEGCYDDDYNTTDYNRSSWPYRKEKIIYMPRSLFCCDHRQSAPDSNARRRSLNLPLHTWESDVELRKQLRCKMFPNIPDGAFLMGNFNQLYKIDPTVFVTWLRILQRLPNAYLWLLQFPKNGERNIYNYALRWTGGSHELASRIIFTPVAEKDEHIIRSRLCDIFLDTPECNAHTTAADVIWAGTPIITFPRHGHKLCSRIGASIVYGAIPEDSRGRYIADRLVVNSEIEYEDRVIEFGSSLEGINELEEIRKILFEEREREDSRGLFNTKQWVESVEKGYQLAWKNWIEGRNRNIFI